MQFADAIWYIKMPQISEGKYLKPMNIINLYWEYHILLIEIFGLDTRIFKTFELNNNNYLAANMCPHM